jgi:hypothetical protein
MKKIFTLLTAIVFSTLVAQAQYYYVHFPTAEENPGGLNTDIEQPTATGWTQIATTSATPIWSTTVNLPFVFTFNGEPMTEYKVSTSGVLTFTTGAGTAPTSTNAALPDAAIPNNSICIWGLAGIGANDGIRQKTFGVSPNRQHWIQFNSYSAPGATGQNWTYWGIVLEETTNRIYLVDQRTFTTPLTLSLGLQIDASTAYQVTGAPNTNSTVTNGGNADTDIDNAFYMFAPGTQPANDAQLRKLTIPGYVAAPSNNNISGRIVNYGSDPITSITIKYQVDGGAVVSDTKNGLNIAAGANYDFIHATPLNIATAGVYNINVWVELTGDANGSNDSSSTSVNALSFFPTKRIVFEEATGTWCQWCPRGAVFMDQMHHDFPDKALLIAVHNADPMAVAAYDAGLTVVTGGGWPNGAVDRKGGAFDPSEFPDLYVARIDEFALCDVTPEVTFDGTSLKIDIDAHFAVSLSGDYRFNAVVVEDGVTGSTTAYAQVNAYSGGGNGVMGGYELLPNPVPAAQMVYDHVARAILGGFDGEAASLPATINADETHSHTFNYTVPAAFDVTKMHVIAWVSDATTGEIINANRGSSNLGVSNNKDNRFSFRTYPNPSNGSTTFALSLDQASNLSFEVYDMFGKKVYAEDKGLVNAGATEFTWNADETLANGMYNVMMRVGNNLWAEKMVLNR